MTKSKIFGNRKRTLINSPLWTSIRGVEEEIVGISAQCTEEYHNACPRRSKMVTMLDCSIFTRVCWCHGNRRGRSEKRRRNGMKNGSAAAVEGSCGPTSSRSSYDEFCRITILLPQPSEEISLT
jgi:hypothetical protein